MNKKTGLRFTVYGLLLVACCLPFTAAAQAPQQHVTVGGNVYGGGNLAAVSHNSSVTINQGGAVINGDVYGGGALAHVGTNGNDTTTVNILNDTVKGNVYGGGLGDTTTLGEGHSNVAALVNGKVYVNIGALVDTNDYGFASSVRGSAVIKGSVFGCNNVNGTPKDSVFVNIYSTAHTTTPNNNTTGATGTDRVNYAIYQVFGGGNKAHYEPAASKQTTVHIWTCDNTIEYVYGGGNAANVGDNSVNSATDVIVDGGRMEWVFGGGNGAGVDNPGANIKGSTNVTFHAGEITYIFGGSNEKGDVTVSKNVDILADNSNCSTKHIASLYGGSNQAITNGSIEITMGCNSSTNNCQIDTLFGGSRKANVTQDVTLNINGGTYDYVFAGNNVDDTIKGNVTLNLHGGTIREAAFGGNNGGGAILGNITVNVADTSKGCPLNVKDIFGAGNLAKYTAPTGGGARANNPIVYVNRMRKDASITGNVYGAGNGDMDSIANQRPGMVTGNPLVVIGDNVATDTASIAGNVYGGGNAAKVVGNTKVIMKNALSSVDTIFGGGNLAEVTGSTTDSIYAGTVSGDVYGGGALANTGSTTVVLSSGTVNGSLYGGGLGDGSHAAMVNGTATVVVDSGRVNGAVFGCNNVNGSPTGAVSVTINGSDPHDDVSDPAVYAIKGVYGGGNLAAYTSTNDLVDSTTVTINGCATSVQDVFGGGNAAPVPAAKVIVYGGIIDRVFAGGNGESGTPAHVGYNSTLTDVTSAPQYGTGNASVHIVSGTIQQVFGGANSSGRIRNHSLIDINKTAGALCEMNINQVFGGGNLADGKAATINVGCTGVYAVGEGITQLFGGANQADVDGDILLNITGGNIDAVFGGNNRSGSISGTITVNVEITNTSCNDHISNVFGGGMMAAYTGDPVVNIKHGTIYGSVFGAGYGDESDATHEIGKVTGNPQVTIGDTTPAHQVTINGSVYGGGQSGNVAGTPVIHVLNKCNTTISDNVYGGCQAAEVTGTSVTIDGGTIDKVFGGGEGESMADVAANVNGDVAVTVTGGTIDKVFGGCNSMGNVSGTVTMNINKGATSCEMHIGEVYGGGNEAAGNAGTITIGCTGDYTNNSEGIGNVYAGANAANVTNNITLNINGGHIDTVFGGNNASGDIAGTTTVNVNWDDELSCDNNYLGTLFGGGNLASMTGSDTVNMRNGTVSHNLFGGGNKAGTGSSSVNMTGGTVLEGFYGGNNTSGTVTGNIAVNITGGTVGANGSPASVFGGGYGNNTSTDGNVTVNINGASAVVWGDVYGGSGFGNVGNDINDAVVVNILNGEVKQNVFGGGLGQKSPNNYAATEAGTVTVNIGSGTPASVEGGASSVAGGAIIGGSVYGCNNTNGSPNGDVTVNIFQTAHISGNAFADAGYALTNVFGGGKEADYIAPGKKAYVNVYTCDNTIGTLFGGGDAAEVPGTQVSIYGGRIGTVYGGGNGAVTAANVGTGGITLNLHGGTIGTLISASNQRGTISGPVNVTVDSVNGCTEVVEDFFGGSNMVDITGDVTTTIECGAGTFRNVYGGSNKANITGNVTLNVQGGNIGRVFGGSKGDLSSLGAGHTNVSADISGTVELNLQGGTIGCAFGGSNINGTIGGDITVNVEDQGGTCPLAIDSVFGAGNLTAYSHTPTVNIKHGTVGNRVPGVVFGGGKGLTAVVTGSPVVNIGDNNAHRAIVTGSVFGGGDAAAVTGNPVVTYNDNNANSYVGNLYGGGNAAGIDGNTQVTLTRGRVLDGIYGGCNTSGTVTGNSTVDLLGGRVGTSSKTAVVFGGGYGQATSIAGNVTVTMGSNDSTANPILYADIYGGSALGNVNTSSSDTTTLNILSGSLQGNIFGGGLGQLDPSAIAPKVNGKVQINIGYVVVDGSDSTFHGNADLEKADVYGCNNVNGSPQDDVHIDVYATAHPTGTLVDDTLSHRSYAIANLYGGGNAADYAPENNNHSSAKKTYVHVYGCDNTIGELFGGGNAAAVVGDSVYIEGGRFNEIFGGGNGAVTAANVGLGGIHLNARSGRVGYIFEQCNMRGRVDGITKYYHGGGSCNEGVLRVNYYFCGGNIQDIFGDSVYVFTCSDKVRYMALYGGCRLGRHYGNIRLEIEGGTIGEVYGGSQGMDGYSADVRKYPRKEDVEGHEADYPTGILDTLIKYPELQGTGGNVTVIIKGGTIGSVFGGCNVNGNVEGSITVIIDSAESDACPLDLDYVYGGGNFARYVPTTVANFNYPYIQLKKGHVNHNVYGGGHGSRTDVDAGRVESNPHIVMNPADGKFWVKGNIYGGGEMGSVGQYTRDGSGKPTACAANTGHTTIEISAGRVGPAVLKMPDYSGHVFGGSRGAVGDTTAETGNPKLCYIAYVHTSDVTISGTAFIKGSVYGGGESGRIFDSTYVKIEGGQIGCGWNEAAADDAHRDLNRVYTDAEWLYDVTSDNTKFLYECNHWPFGNPSTGKYDPYDPYEHPQAYDGHTFYGNVFGGGSGMMPYKSRNIADNADSSLYIQSAGRVLGTTRVEVTGGHILTSLYGGCELGDVLDTCTVIFSGGTLGVPRTLAQIAAHPVTCYLFGAGKGDERGRFNTRTNVSDVRVIVDGGTIYGSVFGGGEDGHVMRDVLMDIKPGAKIGTWGTSYVDGNVFGGGRGFSGNALTAGNVAGDITVNITGGTMLGSIYGGGRLASVGYGLYPADNPNYGVMRPDDKDDAGNTVAGFSRGHITVDISGNTVIGNDNLNINGEYDYNSEHSKGGNVFGGSMGRLTKLDGTMVLPLWHRLGCAKATTVNIRDSVHVKGNVYGGSELGRVTDSITVNISGNVIVGRNAAGSYGHGNVYGGGFGQPELTAAEKAEVGNAATSDSIPTFAGLTGGTIQVNISGGAINNNVYGGGELASVGTIATVTKHTDPSTSYYLSWPYEYTYSGTSGDARVNITGGTIGFINGSDTTGGNIYGSARGTVGDRYVTGRLATARATHVNIDMDSSQYKIIGTVYGSGENGHVYDSAVVTLRNGLVLGSVFGGGKGVDKYTDQLKDPSDDHLYNATVYDIIAGKVFGNTKVNILGGRVAKNVYGGGNLASVGIGNYKGYGEGTNVSSADSLLAENSGHCYVTILGGTIGPGGLAHGTVDSTSDYFVTTGHVFGAGKGIVYPAAEKVGFDYDRNYFVAYVNKTTVVIGDPANPSSQYTNSDPHVTGNLFGGGENGHVRFDTYIQTNRGQIGLRPIGKLFHSDQYHWRYRGSIFGAGRGEDTNPDGSYCQSAGSVTRNTTIDIFGARIYRNVQGGGAMASVGPIKGRDGDSSTCVINIEFPSINDTIGGGSNNHKDFGGYIGGGSRGIPSPDGYDNSALATCHNSQINIYKGWIKNTIYGGGENGQMLGNTQINVYGNEKANVNNNVYGNLCYVRSAIYAGGKGAWKDTTIDTRPGHRHDYDNDTLSGYVYGNTTINALGGELPFLYGGCRRASVGGNATINIGKDNGGTYVGEASFIPGKDKVYGGNQYAGSPRGNIYVNVYKTAHTITDAATYTEDDGVNGAPTYAINYVYGGSYNSPYLPHDSGHYAQVHVFSCENTINEVYGGCAAADVGAKPGIGASTKLIIDGGRFNKVYGGGDGTFDRYLGTAVPANIYGAAITEIHGGTIGSLFGGSNFKGQADTIRITVDANGPCGGTVDGDEFFGGSNVANLDNVELSTTLGCGVRFNAAYGGSNQADITGNISLTIEGGEFNEVYGGSKGAIVAPSASAGMKDTVKADIDGNTHLTILGGKIHNAFGGSNINGNITGTITVDIDSTDNTCGWNVDYVYGGSNLAQCIPTNSNVTSPQVNILCGTVNNDVYGGGKGSSTIDTAGLVRSNPQVTMSQGVKGNTWVKGSIYGGGELAQTDGSTQVSVSGGKVGSSSLGGAHYGNVYGGGMGNETTISAGLVKKNTKVFISGGHIYHCVYGGGEQASVGTFTYDNSNPYYSRITALASNTGHAEVYITGGIIGHNSGDSNEDGHENGMVYGSSRGDIAPLGNIRDALAWVGSTTVCIGDTTEASGSPVIQGSTYGGGENGHVYKDAYVRIHRGTIGNINDISYGSRGNVYGAGCGTDELNSDGEVVSFNPESGIVRGNTRVNITGGQVARNVYGGGSMGSVGTYTYDADGLPENPAANTGKCYVTVSGGIVGPITSQLVMPAYVGMVFGGTRGETVDTTRYTQMPRLANCRTTEVEISGTAFIKGSVYGGCEAGHVLGDTWVKVQGGQVGCGKGQSEAYSAEVFKTIPLAEDLPADWPDYECPSWPYGVNVGTEGDPQIVYAAYDKFASTEAGHEEEYPDGSSTATGRASGSDGHTFYGNVFGGGSGYFPYAAGKWVRSAGRVNGNTRVDITGGHIITSIYGGNECTDVLGTATVNFGGTATLGVPRTLAQIDNHPVTCYLFGAGKGDERIFFNQWTNVASATVTVDGGTIYGSVFGGGEDGHVLGNTEVNINNDDGDNAPIIGTEGLSYVDGNVFGGGRGFSGYALTAGAVCGNVTVTIKDGTMLGSIYGGGRLASVGTYLAPVNDPNYGKMQEGNNHGFILVNISGGTIGNLAPYVFFSGDKPAKLSKASYGTVKIKNGKGQRYEDLTNILTHTTSGNVFGGCMGRVTLLDGTTNPIWPDLARAKKTRVVISGSTIIRSSVYGGGEMGTVRDSTTVLVYGGTIGTDIAPDDASLKTALSKYSNATKFANFYADTGHYFYDENFDPIATRHDSPSQYRNGAPHYYFGSVFGGGYGNLSYDDPGIDLDINHTPDLLENNAPYRLPAVEIAGRVYGNTYVRVKGGIIRENVYGGGDLASVGTPYYASSSDAATEGVSEGDMLRYNDGTGVCHVVVGDTIINAVTYSPVIGPIDFTAQNGNVYAAGKGVGIDPDEHYKEYCNVASTDLKVSGGKIWGNTFGGGADCHVLYNTKSLIEAGVDNGDINVGLPDIGDMGITEYDGYVFGGGRNFYNTNATAGRVGGHTSVKVTGGRIRCSVIGGGALARVGVDVDGDVDSFVDNSGNYDSTHHGSTYITVSGIKETVTSSVFNSKYKAMFVGTTEADGGNVVVYHTTIGTGVGPHLLDCDYTIGDIFGGGKGDTKDTTDIMAGRVMNTYVRVTGSPRIMADIYAGAEMASVGWWDTNRYEEQWPDNGVWPEGQPTVHNNHDIYYTGTGYTHVTISGTPYTGTPYEFSTENYIRNRRAWTLIDSLGRLTHTCSGNVYGGGQGYVEEKATHRWNWVHMGRVRHTEVEIYSGSFMGNVFGGGSRGVVKEDCHVTIYGGHIGCVIHDESKKADGVTPKYHNNEYYYGSVFGGGYGNPKTFWHISDSSFVTNTGLKLRMRPTEQAGRVYGNTYVTISGGQIMDCVYGGGDMASTGWVERNPENGNPLFDDETKRHGGKCYVDISGNTIVGPLDYNGHNAYVYAAGRGVGYDPDEINKTYCNVNEAHLVVHLTSSTDPAVIADTAHWSASTHGGRIWGSLFGGGADCHVLGDVSTTVHSGVVGTNGITSYDGNIFGGGRNYLHTNTTNGRVQGNIDVLVDGGTLRGTIFGGGRMAQSGVDSVGSFSCNHPDEHGNVTITVNTDNGPVVIGNNNSAQLLRANESLGDIFGSGKGDTKDYDLVWAGRVTSTQISVSGSPTIYGAVFGGGEMASVGHWDEHGVFIEGTGDTRIDISGSPTIGTQDEFETYVRPTHVAHADRTGTDNPGDWTIYDDAGHMVHSCTGNVFGGCQGDVDVSAPHWVSMGRSNNATVNISGTPRIRGSVYGGSEQGSLVGSTHVTIEMEAAGHIGTQLTHLPDNLWFGDVYGGGYGADEVADSAATYVDEETGLTEDVENDSTGIRTNWRADYLAGRVYGDTRVDILGGRISGNVYGGGERAYVGDEARSGAAVHGNTLVNIGLPSRGAPSSAVGSATLHSSVFGANNIKGTPYGNTEVHIYKTAHTAIDTCPKNATTMALVAPTNELTEADVEALPTTSEYFAIESVYGGGNKAAHTPVAADGTTLVHVHYCEENTIHTVYGGSNGLGALTNASTQNNHVIIEGGRIYEVFGGGNGAGNSSASVGDLDYNPGADVKGTAWTEIEGGLITDVFGGSNSKGDVNNIRLDIEPDEDCPLMVANTYGGSNEANGGGGEVNLMCGTHIGTFYGGSRKANLVGDITLNVYGGIYENIFGGSQGTVSEPANIEGNVTLNFYGGNVQRLFGGSDVNGNITGTVLVNVDIDPDYSCPDGLRLDTVYGAGRNAAYTPYDPYRGSPTVNVMNNRHFVSGSTGTMADSAFVEIIDVFGGGLGATATTTSYPRVIIGGFGNGRKNTGTEQDPVWTPYTRGARVFGNAYGGGSMAPVKGNTYVLVRDAVIGRDNEVESFTSGNLFGGGYGTTSKVMGDTYVGVFGLSDIKSNVYGGGNAGIVTGNTEVVVGYQKQVIVPELIAYIDEVNYPGEIRAGLHSTTPNVHFRYTTDGTTPTTSNGTLYTDDILSDGHDNAHDFEINWDQPIQMIGYLWDGPADETSGKIDSSMIPSIVGFGRSTSPLITFKDGTAHVGDPDSANFNGSVGAKIYYTLNGDEPTSSSTPWGTVREAEGSAFAIGANDVVKAIAVQRGCFDSEVSFLTADAPTVDNGTNTNIFTVTAKPGERIIYTLGTTDIPTPISLMNHGQRPGQGPGETGMVESTDDAPGHTTTASDGSTVTHKKRVYTNSNGETVTYRWSEVTAASSGPTTVTITVPGGTDCTVKAIVERAGHAPSPIAADVYRH